MYARLTPPSLPKLRLKLLKIDMSAETASSHEGRLVQFACLPVAMPLGFTSL